LPPEEVSRAFEEMFEEYEVETQRRVDQIKEVWNDRWKGWRDELEFCCECSKWVRSAPQVLRKIKIHSSQEMRKLKRAQCAESEKLSSTFGSGPSRPE
jgi:hypothetical protein